MKPPTLKALLAVRGVIFDLDDTLVASQLDFTAIRQAVGVPLGQGVIEYIDTLQGEAKQIAERTLYEAEWQGAKRAEWMLGAKALVMHLHQHRVPLAIVTRNARDIALAMIQRLRIPIDYLLAREDCAPKPSPEGLLMIANQWQLSPTSIMYVGDFKYDMAAAAAADMVACLYVPAHKRDQLAANAVGADWVIDDLLVLKDIATKRRPTKRGEH